MTYVKTELGAQAIKDRHATRITWPQRAALILFDGQRPTGAVMDATAALGITRTDIELLASLGLIAASKTPDKPADAPLTDFASSTLAAKYGDMDLPVAPNDQHERIRRYKKAYPLATQITAKLGLRGFKLNLAVEAAQGLEGLVELLPRLHAAVGDERLRPLKRALEGR